MCKKQTSVSRSCTESEILSLDAGLRMDGLPALHLWDVVIDVLRSSNSTKPPTNPTAGNCSRNHKSNPKQKGDRDVEQVSVCGLRYVTTNAHSSQGKSQLYISEDNEAVIKMIIKSRVSSPRELRKVLRKSCETETNEFGVKEPPESEEKVFRKIWVLRTARWIKSWIRVMFHPASRNWCETATKTQQHIPKSGDKMTLYLRAPGNWERGEDIQFERSKLHIHNMQISDFTVPW